MGSRKFHWVWPTFLGIAFLLRFAALGRSPLAPDEALRAVSALDLARGRGWPLSTDSPLLFNANALLFLLTIPENAIARSLPALAGVLLVLVPYLWRKRLGELGAWVASGLLAFSPLLLFAARRVDSTSLGVLGAILVLSSLFLDAEQDEVSLPMRAVLLTAGLAIGLTGGPAFYDGLVPGSIAYGFYVWMQRKPPGGETFKRLGRSAGLGVVFAMLIGAAFGLHWSGWGAIGEGLAAWFATWRSVPSSGPEPMSLLTLYELLTLLLAVGGLFLALRNRRPLLVALALWVALGLLLIGLRSAVAPLSVVAVSVPLALLSTATAEELLRLPKEIAPWVGLHALLGGAFWLPAILSATQQVGGTLNASPWMVVTGGVVLLALQCLLAFLMTLVLPPRWIWRGALLGVLLIVAVTQVSFATNLAFVRSDSPAELAVEAAGSADLVTLRSTLGSLAVLRGHRQDSFPITVVDLDAERTALVRWALRGFSALTVVPEWPSFGPEVVITPAGIERGTPSSTAWIGREFVAAARYPERVPVCRSGWLCRERVAWYLYRRIPTSPTLSRIIVWIVPSDQP